MADAFRKSRPGHEAGRFFAAEAAGLDWIRVPGGPPVPAVLARDTGSISLQRIREVPPSRPRRTTSDADWLPCTPWGHPASGHPLRRPPGPTGG